MSNWLTNAIFYEIYPQSFMDTNGDGIGDLRGITQKLDYVRDLGCNALWINPCFDSPFHDAGYDVSDYMRIAPRYGTNEDMRELLKKAHSLSIHVLLDLVPGHTSIEHGWFTESMKFEENKYSKRFIWSGTPWERFAGIGNISGSLNGISERGSVATSFFSTQPALNYGFANPDPQKPWQLAVDAPEARATREAMMDVMRFWLSMGCDGFRVDMAASLVKNDDGHEETIKLWQEVRAFLDKEFPHAVLLAEWGEPDYSFKAGFHMDYLLHVGASHYSDLFRDDPYFSGTGRKDLQEFISYSKDMYVKTCDDGLICICSSNHDMSRIAFKLNEIELKLAFTFLLTMPGVPLIYYGDEIGMKYLDGIAPVEGGYERTGSRSPMQWDNTLNAGFSAAPPDQLYIMIDPDKDRPNVDRQASDPDSLLNEVRRLTKLRLAHAALNNTSRTEFLTDGTKGQPLVYVRGTGNDAIYVVINTKLKPVAIPSSCNIPGIGDMDVIHTVGAGVDGGLLQPQSAMIVRKI